MNSLISILLLACLIFLTGCDSKQVRIGDTPPDISGNDINGDTFTLNQRKGKVSVLFFWRDSCCGDRLKQLEPFYLQNKERGLAVLAVNAGDSKTLVKSYAKNNGLTFTLLTDERAKTTKQYNIFGFPTIFILDNNGVVREKILGDIQNVKLQKLVEKQFSIQKEIEANYEKNHPR